MGGRTWRVGDARMARLRGRRLALAALAGALLPGAALLGRAPTHTTVDRFEVDLANLRATTAYRVSVASDSPRLGIGGCGQAAQTRTLTGVTAQTLPFVVYACAVGEGTVTAAVRRAGASAAEASVSQRETVAALPEIVIGPTGARIRTTQAAAHGPAQAATAQGAAQGDGPALCRGSASRRPIDKPPRSR